MPLPSLNIFEKMRGLFHPGIQIRRKILAEVAKMIVENKAPEFIETIPYIIIPTNIPTFRDCVFHERAIVRERVRLAFGLDLKEFGAHGPIIDDVKSVMIDKKFLNPPIVNVIKAGCERCPVTSYFVSNLCRGCIAHPCVLVCPKNAVSIVNNRSQIDQELCIKCGKCAQVCPYNAIAYRERPCAAACGVGAISSDEEGFAEIDPNNCVSCGLCIVSCPFGAIAEKSEIVQILYTLKSSKKVYAIVAPSFVGQFGPLMKPEMMPKALEMLGFAGMYEAAYGADIAIQEETEQVKKIIEKVENDEAADKRLFVATSCCPAWVKAARNNFPELARNVSESYTPMVETAKLIRSKDPEARIVFIGPCIAKKTELFNPLVLQYIEFIMTFEELAALFQAKNIDPTKITDINTLEDGSTLGRGFPVAGGVGAAVITNVKSKVGEDWDIPYQSADTLKGCMDLLKKVQNKQIQPFPILIEGMACPNGCVGGPGTLSPIKRAQIETQKFAKQSKWKTPDEHIPQK